MNSETLVTFYIESVPSCSTIQLLGSWDNFTTPYEMEKDKQKGHGHWHGCHTFRNIICNGDPADCEPARTGCLRMGGTYWYYYKLNGHVEWHNPLAEHTTACPLLPGQSVNVLEVPLEEHDAGSAIDAIEAAYTLNPKDRFQNPKSCWKRAASVSQDLPVKKATSCIRRLRTAPGILFDQLHWTQQERLTHSSPHDDRAVRKEPAVRDASLFQRLVKTRPPSLTAKASRPSDSGFKTHFNPFENVLSRQYGENGCVRLVSTSTEDPVARPSTWSPNIDTNLDGNRSSESEIQLWKSLHRPVSEPSRFSTMMPFDGDMPGELAASAGLDRQKSLRLRLACAKLRRYQRRNTPRTAEHLWDMASLPESFDAILGSAYRTTSELRSARVSVPSSPSSSGEELSSSSAQMRPPRRKSFRPQLKTLYSTSHLDLSQSSAASPVFDDDEDTSLAPVESATKSQRQSLGLSVTTSSSGFSIFDSFTLGAPGVESPTSTQADANSRSLRQSRDMLYEAKQYFADALESQETIKPARFELKLPLLEGLSLLEDDVPAAATSEISQQDLGTFASQPQNDNDALTNDLDYLGSLIAP